MRVWISKFAKKEPQKEPYSLPLSESSILLDDMYVDCRCFSDKNVDKRPN